MLIERTDKIRRDLNELLSKRRLKDRDQLIEAIIKVARDHYIAGVMVGEKEEMRIMFGGAFDTVDACTINVKE